MYPPLQTLPELGPKYVALGWQLAELLVVSLVLYLVGRLAVKPAVTWALARRDVGPTMARAVDKILDAAVVVFALAAGIAAGGFTAFLGGSALVVAALTLALGFAAQDVLSNFVAGVFIVQDRNFNIDDWIEWGDRAGFIEDIGFRVTRVRIFNNETVTVPNTELATTAVTNRMSNELLGIAYLSGTGYTDDVLDDPEPSVRIADLGDNAVVLQARFWIADPDREDFSVVRSAYIQRARERCEAAGIDLSTTTRHDLSGELTVADVPADPP
jgi:small conductance mechanosensitive channel